MWFGVCGVWFAAVLCCAYTELPPMHITLLSELPPEDGLRNRPIYHPLHKHTHTARACARSLRLSLALSLSHTNRPIYSEQGFRLLPPTGQLGRLISGIRGSSSTV